MEECGLVLNLHGECPSDHAKNITVLNAESSFLPVRYNQVPYFTLPDSRTGTFIR